MDRPRLRWYLWAERTGRVALQVDYGQAQIQAFNDAAASGNLEFDEGVVREVVRQLDTVIDGLQAEIRTVDAECRLDGMGGFRSSRQLGQGFTWKAEQYQEVLQQHVAGAMRLQEAFLRAAGLFEEADGRHAAAFRVLGDSMEAT
ncbi:hypothetical protein [Nocardia sp. CNY236]|uniref:hypothetical protein n=1 Tax=Nocardia sp. CNY236 TaxID=1169152 RepID=UPI0012DF5EB9|nr:hypothetical protein [Nocardia sp. CNY236]